MDKDIKEMYKKESETKSFKNYLSNIKLSYYTMCGYLMNICNSFVFDNYKTIYFSYLLKLIEENKEKIKNEYENYLKNPDKIRDQEDLHDFGISHSDICKNYLKEYENDLNNLQEAHYNIIMDEFDNNDIELFASEYMNLLPLGSGENEIENIETEVMKIYNKENNNEN